MEPDTNIPTGIYFSRKFGDFYDVGTNEIMGKAFSQAWFDRRDEFPPSPHGERLNEDPTASPELAKTTEFPKLMKDEPPIPEGVYYNLESQNFHNIQLNTGMGNMFYNKWVGRRDEFPQSRALPDKKLQ